MEQFSELKSALVGAWADAHADAISHGDGEAEGFLDSLRDQISGYADMSAEDADTLGIEISDADIAAWQTFVAQCAKEYLVRWQIATRYPLADVLTADDIVSLIMDVGTIEEIYAIVDSYMDR